MSTLNIKSSTIFPYSAVFVGYLFMAIGVVGFIVEPNFSYSIIIILIGILLSFSTYGIVLDAQNKKFKSYAAYFGIKTGSWDDLNVLPDITIFASNESSQTFSGAMHSNIKEDRLFKVFLLSENHRKKVIVKKCKTKAEAKEIVNLLVETINVNYTKFNPPKVKRNRR